LSKKDDNDGRGTREAQPAVPDDKDRYSPCAPVQSAAGRSFIEPGSPWQNPFVESFGSRVRDEVLPVEACDSVLEAQTVITDWRTIYNHRRPHSSLGWRLPRPMPLA
jgi:transposase InsO family protein